MKKTKLFSLVTAVALTGSLLLSSCVAAGGSSKYPGTPNPNEATINITTEPPKMNSILTTDSTSFNILRHITEGLTSLDKDDNVVKGAAEDWTISEDKLTYTFTLKDGLTWSDGVPVTANDFKFAWMTLLKPETAAEYNYMGFVFKNGEAYNTGEASAEDVAITVKDDKTIEFTLEAPTPYMLTLLSFGSFMPVREDKYNDAYATEASNIVCNGPYIMESWNHESDITLVKNPNYWGADDIKIEKINMMMINDSNTSLNSYKSGELDMMLVSGDQSAQLKEEGETVLDYSDGSNWVLAYNLTREATANINVRKALTLSLDRERFIKDVLKNGSIPSYNWCPTTIKNGEEYFLKDIKPTFKDNDLEAAKKAWADATAELGSAPKLSVVCDDTDNAKLQAAYYQECWKQAGIEVEIISVPFKDRLNRQKNQEYDISIYGWSADFNDPISFLDLWHSTSGNNIIGLQSENYDANVEAAKKEGDVKKRTEMLVAMEKELVDNFYVGPIYNRMPNYITSGKLEGVVRTPFQDYNLRWATAK